MTRFYCLAKLWWETLLLKRDILAHPRRLISAFAVRCLDSIISLVSSCSISWLYLASVAEQAGWVLPVRKPEDRFSHSHDEARLIGGLDLMTIPTKWHVRPAKTQFSLCIRPVWSETSLSAWTKLWSSATHWAHSEDSDQTGQMPRRSESSLGAQSFCWFCHEAAQITINSQNSVFSDDRHSSVKEDMLINLERGCSSMCR